jgi:hypothetical protein
METKDYSITVRDNRGRVAVLSIDGASVDECVATGLPLPEVCERLESEAFQRAVEAGKINARAVCIASDNSPI